MVPESSRQGARAVALLSLSLALLAMLSTPVAAQSWVGSDLPPAVSVPLQFGVSFVVNLVAAGLVLAVAPEYARTLARDIRANVVESIAAGILAEILVVVATVLLALTIVGLVVVIPGLLVLAVLQFGATGIALLAVGSALGGRSSPDGAAVLLGALVVAGLGLIPLVGPLLNSLVGVVGFGAMASDYWGSR